MLLSAAAAPMRSAGGSEARARLAEARLMLVFTPGLARDPLAALEAALPWVDLVQVRAKEGPGGTGGPDGTGATGAIAPARECHAWCLRVLELVAARGSAALVLVDDRVDVALALAGRGVAGVHVGADDCPLDAARRLLGPEALLGLSTHDARQVAAAQSAPADYLGFGPVFPTATKGYARGLGPEAAWVAAAASLVPVFPIGGIDVPRAAELAPVGRAAVGAAILAAPDPGAAARAIRLALA